MVQSVGWKDLAFDESEVGADVCAVGFEDDDGMSDWIETVFVDPGVEGADVDVADDFPFLDHLIQFDGVGTSAEEGVTGFEPGHESERVDEVAHDLVLLFAPFPFAFPHDDETVALGDNGVFPGAGGLVDVTHGQVTHSVTRLVTVRKTLGTSVPETAVKFVDGVRGGIVAIHVDGLGTVVDHVFATIAYMSNVVVGSSIEVRQPLEGGDGMGFALGVPTVDGFGGQTAFWHVLLAVEEVASRGDGHATFQRIEPADLLEFLAKDLAGAFEEKDVGLAVGQEFGLEIKDVVWILLCVPLFEFTGSFDRHALRVVVVWIG